MTFWQEYRMILGQMVPWLIIYFEVFLLALKAIYYYQ